MKAVERAIDRVAPAAGVRLRVLKKQLRKDMSMQIIDALVRAGDAVLDVGAYRGVYTLALASKVGRGGRVWAIEPFPPNVAAIARATGGRPQVSVCAWAASAQPGRETLHVPVYQGHRLGALATVGSPAGVATETFEVQLRPLDELCDGADGDRPLTFLRCDVVGHEADVLAGAGGCLRRHRPALLLEIEQRHQERPIQKTFDDLAALGYEAYFVRGQALFPLAEFDLERDQLALVPEGFVPYGMPAGYVHYFLFVRPGTDLGSLPLQG